VSYCTATQVMARDTGRTYTASSRPNPDQVADFVIAAAGEIDALLRGRGYQLPIPTTATSALSYLAGGNIFGAAAFIEQSAPGGAPNRRDDAIAMWERWKKALTDPLMDLDAPKNTSRSRTRSPSPPPTAMFRRGECP
jgi:hypothetical protein